MIRYRLNEEGIFPLTRWELDGRAIRPYALQDALGGAQAKAQAGAQAKTQAEETASGAGGGTAPGAPGAARPKAWIYAFVVGNRVMYLGATGRALKDRLDDFETSHHPASLRIREQIRKALMDGKEVEICARAGLDPDTLRLEADDLADELDPPWNRIPPGRGV